MRVPRIGTTKEKMMLENILRKLDVLPGGKTYWLAGIAAVLHWGVMVELIPVELADKITRWLVGLMTPTVLQQLAR